MSPDRAMVPPFVTAVDNWACVNTKTPDVQLTDFVLEVVPEAQSKQAIDPVAPVELE